MSDTPILISGRKPRITHIKVRREFRYKLNCANHGGPSFETRDFVSSQEAECAVEDAVEVGRELFAACRAEVFESVREYLSEMAARSQRRTA